MKLNSFAFVALMGAVAGIIFYFLPVGIAFGFVCAVITCVIEALTGANVVLTFFAVCFLMYMAIVAVTYVTILLLGRRK